MDAVALQKRKWSRTPAPMHGEHLHQHCPHCMVLVQRSGMLLCTAGTVYDDGCSFLAIPLLSAERAWAMAMEIKGQLAAGPEAPKRMHLQRRLWKAAAWGAELTRLAAERGDARTGGTAAACACCMHELITIRHLQQASQLPYKR